MSKRKIEFLVRGFDYLNEPHFNKPTGIISDKITFGNFVVKKQYQAIALMFSESGLRTMTVPVLLDPEFDKIDIELRGVDSPHCNDISEIIHVIDLSFVLNTTDKKLVRELKPKIFETLMHWAEKSRVKDRRGWRLSAIKSPQYDYSDITTVSTQVILSNAILYSSITADITPQENDSYILEDLLLLSKKLLKALQDPNAQLSIFHNLNYNHSLIGKGIVFPNSN